MAQADAWPGTGEGGLAIGERGRLDTRLRCSGLVARRRRDLGLHLPGLARTRVEKRHRVHEGAGLLGVPGGEVIPGHREMGAHVRLVRALQERVEARGRRVVRGALGVGEGGLDPPGDELEGVAERGRQGVLRDRGHHLLECHLQVSRVVAGHGVGPVEVGGVEPHLTGLPEEGPVHLDRLARPTLLHEVVGAAHLSQQAIRRLLRGHRVSPSRPRRPLVESGRGPIPHR